MKKLAEQYFVNSMQNVATNSRDLHEFVEFYFTLGKFCDNFVSNRHEIEEFYNNYKNNNKYWPALVKELPNEFKRNPRLQNPSHNNFSVKINNHGVKKSLFSYATSSTEILEIIKRYVKPGDKVRLLSGTRVYNFKVLSTGKFKKI